MFLVGRTNAHVLNIEGDVSFASPQNLSLWFTAKNVKQDEHTVSPLTENMRTLINPNQMDHMNIFIEVVLQHCTVRATDISTAMYHTCTIQRVYSEYKKWFHSYDTC